MARAASWELSAHDPFEHPLFAGVDAAQLQSHGHRLRPVRLQRGVLVGGPQIESALILVLRGMLQAHELSPDGQRVVIEIVGAGEIDGVLQLAGVGTHMCEAVADSIVVRINLAQLETMMQMQPQIRSNLYLLALRKMAKREAQMLAMSENIGVRAVARQLLALARYEARSNGELLILRPRLSHQLLADMVGLRRETVTLSLRTISEFGAVGFNRDSMWLDVKRLAAILAQYPASASQRLSNRFRQRIA